MKVYSVGKYIPYESDNVIAIFTLEYDAEAYALMRGEEEGRGGYEYYDSSFTLDEQETL